MHNIKVVYNTGNIEKYKSKNFIKQYLVHRFTEKIVELAMEMEAKYKISKKRKLSLLDVGCGEGFISKLLSEKLGVTTVVGIDGAAEAVAIAKKLHPMLEFRQGNVYSLDAENNSADIVICSEVLEHLSDPARALKELCRVARCAVLISVPNEPWFCLGNLVSLHNVSTGGNPKDHVNHWTYWGFKKFIGDEVPSDNVEYAVAFPWTIACIQMRNIL